MYLPYCFVMFVDWTILRVKLMHMERRWRHVSTSCGGQKLQRGEEKSMVQIMYFL